MPKWISAAFALFLSLQVFSTRGETAEDIINHYVKAMGGRDMLQSVKTIYSEAVLEENGKKVIIRTHKVPDNYLSTLIDYIPKGHMAELAGKQTINGISCYAVRLTLKSGLVVNYFIDAENWYVIRETRKGVDGVTRGNSELIINYSDYRKTRDGFLFPFKELVGSFPQKCLNYQKIEVNKPVNYPLYKPDTK